MESYHPFANAEWRKTQKGVFNLDDDFYDKSGEILTDSEHYQKMFETHRFNSLANRYGINSDMPAGCGNTGLSKPRSHPPAI